MTASHGALMVILSPPILLKMFCVNLGLVFVAECKWLASFTSRCLCQFMSRYQILRIVLVSCDGLVGGLDVASGHVGELKPRYVLGGVHGVVCVGELVCLSAFKHLVDGSLRITRYSVIL